MGEASDDEHDLAGGNLPQGEKVWVDSDLEEKKQRRQFRQTMFGVLKIVVIAYLTVLLLVFAYLFFCRADDIARVSNTGALVFFGVALGLFSAVPLSLALTMRHIASEPARRDDLSSELDISPAQIGLIKAIVEIVKTTRE